MMEMKYVESLIYETVSQVQKKRTQAVVETMLMHSPKLTLPLRTEDALEI